MAYVPSSGWVEVLHTGDNAAKARVVAKFHSCRECPRIHDAANVREVDKPYSAVRCALCASDDVVGVGTDLPRFARTTA